MEIIKSIFDYSKTPFEYEIAKYIATKLDCALCCEKIKNKNFMIKNLKPLNNFVVYSNAILPNNLRKVNS